MKAEHIKVKLGPVTVNVPVCNDVVTTQKIAKIVTDRLNSIEKKSKVIDTQAFALHTAFSFASEIELLTLEKSENTKEILLALDKLNDTLVQIIEDSEEE